MKPGKTYAAVAVKDLRPLRGARARASLTAILAPAGTPAMGACPLPALKQNRKYDSWRKTVFPLTERIHFRND